MWQMGAGCCQSTKAIPWDSEIFPKHILLEQLATSEGSAKRAAVSYSYPLPCNVSGLWLPTLLQAR